MKPEDLDHEEATTIPLAFLTVYYCLAEVARLRAGEKVLIHAGAGGVLRPVRGNRQDRYLCEQADQPTALPRQLVLLGR